MMHELGVGIDTFSIGFGEAEYNELDRASEVAKLFDTKSIEFAETDNCNPRCAYAGDGIEDGAEPKPA